MLGVPLDGPTMIFGDNKSVITNLSWPSSPLKKKHNAIAYHKARQSAAAGIVQLVHIPGTENLADVLTKPVNTVMFNTLVKPVLFRKAGDGHSDEGECQEPGNGLIGPDHLSDVLGHGHIRDTVMSHQENHIGKGERMGTVKPIVTDSGPSPSPIRDGSWGSCGVNRARAAQPVQTEHTSRGVVVGSNVAEDWRSH